jgi:hypothetical protein
MSKRYWSYLEEEARHRVTRGDYLA